ncbi:MAG: hypothetical protein NWF09_06430 [Candidatus Bathyarchaeota archaeon]|nr:hypothetical protein [Candidatus Bathyarchaeota archaeon]
MKNKYWLPIVLVSLLIVSLFLVSRLFDDPALNIFVGVDVAYDNVEELKQLVDKISSYTNTIVIGSTGITHNFTKLNDVCQYLYNKSMYFMIYAHPINDPEVLNVQRQWVLDAKPKWGEHFLGLYAYDEPAGRQLDNATLKAVDDSNWYVDNWTDAANKYITNMNLILNVSIQEHMGGLHLPLFTSDYALYWFDYKAGYDVVFAEFGWNYSRHINVALCRGATTVQNKDWGVMITWTYTAPPYLESGEALYNDLVLAYESGAKYILVFDTNEDYTHSVLQPEHLDALKRFWHYAKNNPRPSSLNHNRIAYVLPKDYGYGFRGPADKIWGLWEADNFAIKLSTEISQLIDSYKHRLDIIYDDGLNGTYCYSKIIFWNGTILVP